MKKTKYIIFAIFIVSLGLITVFVFQRKLKQEQAKKSFAQSAGVTVNFDPSDGTLNSSDTTIDINLNTNDNEIHAINLSLEYDPDAVNVSLQEGDISDFHDLYIQNIDGNTINIQGGAVSPYSGNGTLTVMTVSKKDGTTANSTSFEIKSESYAVNVSNDDLNLLSDMIGNDFTYDLQTNSTPTPTNTVAPTDNPDPLETTNTPTPTQEPFTTGSLDPTNTPTNSPSNPTNSPTNSPNDPTEEPTDSPTDSPSDPTDEPTDTVNTTTVPTQTNTSTTSTEEELMGAGNHSVAIILLAGIILLILGLLILI